MDLSDVLKILGALVLVAAGSLISPVVGLAVAGAMLILAGWLTEA